MTSHRKLDARLVLWIYLLSNSFSFSFISIFKTPLEANTLLSNPTRAKGIFGNLTLTHTGSLNVQTPSYTQILKNDVLSVTSFSLLRKGSIMQFDLNDVSKSVTLKGDYLWPNELATFHHKDGSEVLLIPDGFLMPGQSNGGLYAIINPHGLKKHHPVRITRRKDGWFYHRAVYVKLPGGKHGIITARARKPLIGKGSGELVWITIPDTLKSLTTNLHHLMGELDSNDWSEFVLAKGPDVMFEVLDQGHDLESSINIVAAHFFEEKLSIYTLTASEHYPYVKVVRSSTIDTIGKPYGLALASLTSDFRDERNQSRYSHLLVSTHECSYDITSTVQMAWSALSGLFPKILTGSSRRGLRDGESLPVENGENSRIVKKGGSLFAYRIPSHYVRHNNNLLEDNRNNPIPDNKRELKFSEDNDDTYHLRHWRKHTLFRGFKVRGWGGIFSPGAPGFPYVVHTSYSKQPLILLAGDCTGSAYIFAPTPQSQSSAAPLRKSYDETASRGSLSKTNSFTPEYDLAFEIECGATVGSLAVQSNQDNSSTIFIPSYELNKIHVFKLEH